MSWFFAIVFWLFSLLAIGYGFYLTKEVHQTEDYSVRPNLFNISSDSVLGWFFGAIVKTIFALFMGFFFSILPWWLARSIFFGIGIGLFLLGINVLQY